jgi:nucleoside-triphosphatase THEP1
VPAPKLKFDRVEISQRMKDIVEQLKPLCAKVATILDLEISGFNRTGEHNIAADRPKTTTEIIEFKLYGRDNLKKNLVDDITHGKYCANSLTVVSIVGPGGIGKTTFTQHIYQEVSNHFQVLVWICVSQNFNANRVAQEIVNKIPRSDNEKDNASDEELIQIRLQSKKFLLVLDDMWTYHEDEWKKLLAPFKKVGTTGNVVIVTTRIPKVGKMVATTIDCFIRLERLEVKDCMSFFQACVFGDQQSWKEHVELHNLGGEIVTKLKGFPLEVKTVGRLLRNKLTPDHWVGVLESKEWELHSGDDDIMPALKLSYNYLSFDLQQCFSHCALFPEDYEFGREELIHLWIGLGLLDNCDQNNRMEDVGSDYLDALIDHGFFQKSEN